MIADGTTMTSDDDLNKNSNHSDIRVLSPSFFYHYTVFSPQNHDAECLGRRHVSSLIDRFHSQAVLACF